MRSKDKTLIPQRSGDPGGDEADRALYSSLAVRFTHTGGDPWVGNLR